MLKRAAPLCLICLSLLFPVSGIALPAAGDHSAAPQAAVKAETPAPQGHTVIPLGPDGMPLDTSWEVRYVKDTRTTIEQGVNAVLSGLVTPKELRESVEILCRNWDTWAESKLFLLDSARDIDVYGNLYSFTVMCRTLRLAAEDWLRADESREAQSVFNKALWLEKKSLRLAEPVGEIIKNQSYSSFLPRRVEIMEEQFKYVEVCYNKRPFSGVPR